MKSMKSRSIRPETPEYNRAFISRLLCLACCLGGIFRLEYNFFPAEVQGKRQKSPAILFTNVRTTCMLFNSRNRTRNALIVAEEIFIILFALSISLAEKIIILHLL